MMDGGAAHDLGKVWVTFQLCSGTPQYMVISVRSGPGPALIIVMNVEYDRLKVQSISGGQTRTCSDRVMRIVL
jgi:hypothetical protein